MAFGNGNSVISLNDLMTRVIKRTWTGIGHDASTPDFYSVCAITMCVGDHKRAHAKSRNKNISKNQPYLNW